MLTFPTALFSPSSLIARLSGASQSSGQSVSGLTQSGMTSGGGFWSFEFGESILWDRDLFNSWQAIAAIADNGATPFVVPICDRLHQPFLAAHIKRGAGVGDSDDSTFSDGALWSAEYITAAIAGSAALRSTQLNLAITGADLAKLQGSHFTVWHVGRGQRMYRVVQVLSTGAGVATVKIRPPLREATADGAPCDFDNPRCQMGVVGDPSATLEMLQRGSAKIGFVENFRPASEF